MNIFQELKERKVLDKDGKVDALGPYGKSKLTGQEVAQYFKKHKVKDKKIRKAVEVALDLGGAMSVAQKEIKKFFGNSVLKNKDVQKALKYANESFEMNQLVGMLHEHVLNLTEKNLIPDIQKIVDTKGAAKVGGVMIDMFTASMIAQIYDKVNDQNKKKMEKAKIEMLVKIAQKMMQKMEYNPLDEGFKSDAQRRAAFASGYKAKGKKDKKEEVELDENEKGLKNKAEKSGMPLGILKQVYNRGLAAYKTGHRPGATAPQWAMARVNSFVTKSKGTWGGADKDLAAKVQGKKEEVDTLRNTIDEWIAADGTRRRVHERDKRKQKGKLKETPMDSYREMWEDAIMEKKDLDPKVIEKIADMTDRNDHNQAVIELAKALKERKVIKMMELLQKMHKEMGHMTSDMMGMRKDLHNQLMDKSKKSFGNHKDVYNAF